MIIPTFSIPMLGELAQKSKAQVVYPQFLQDMDKLMHPELLSNVPVITEGTIHTEESIASTSTRKKSALSDSPDPHKLLHSQPANADAIKKDGIAQDCHPDAIAEIASKTKLENKNFRIWAMTTPIFPALLSVMFIIGNPNPNDEFCHFIWCFIGCIFVYALHVFPAMVTSYRFSR
jgi:hypothetical protein